MYFRVNINANSNVRCKKFFKINVDPLACSLIYQLCKYGFAVQELLSVTSLIYREFQGGNSVSCRLTLTCNCNCNCLFADYRSLQMI